MQDIVHLLPESVANQIAAGEVVQRPSSVVKELLENAIDAGARNIKLIIKESGKTLVQVIDDGTGMSETDARMCFERHATSKIHKAADLFNIQTLGFRGEAMASIASVSSIELKTKRATDELGTLIMIEGGVLKSHEPIACQDGTCVSVKNLFFNIPVRKNFLKSNNVEYNHIINCFQQIALANTDVKFILAGEREEIFHLPKGNLRNRVIGVLGKKHEQTFLPLTENTPIVKISGFIGKPSSARKTRGEQFLFVNNRFIKNPYFNHAIYSAFEELIPNDHFPLYVLFLEVDPSKVDVNVHPTKTEVKFEDEKGIYLILKASVKKSLGQHHVAPTFDFEQEAFLNNLQTIANNKSKEDSVLNVDVGRKDSSERGIPKSDSSTKSTEQDWKELMKILEIKDETTVKNKETEEIEQINFIETETEDMPNPDSKLIQVHQKYIFTPIHSGIMLIHQQYAHQRVLYEDFLQSFSLKNKSSQKQLFPEVIEFSESDFQIMQEIEPLLASVGFITEVFGKRAYVVNGIPVHYQIGNPEQFIESLIEEYKNNLGAEELGFKENLAQSLAIKLAVKVGEHMEKEEINMLIDQLFACKNPYYSPKGKPIFLKINNSELDKKFE